MESIVEQKSTRIWILRGLLGIICGFAATGPMSAVMIWLHRCLPKREKYPLPPREITTKVIEKANGESLSAESHTLLTWLAHFGYGGAAGAVYPLVRQHIKGSAANRGLIFGVVVWAVSYLGLLPSLQILKPATQHPVRRNLLMIAAHVVWGSILAVIFETLLDDTFRQRTAFQGSKTKTPNDT